MKIDGLCHVAALLVLMSGCASKERGPDSDPDLTRDGQKLHARLEAGAGDVQLVGLPPRITSATARLNFPPQPARGRSIESSQEMFFLYSFVPDAFRLGAHQFDLSLSGLTFPPGTVQVELRDIAEQKSHSRNRLPVSFDSRAATLLDMKDFEVDPHPPRIPFERERAATGPATRSGDRGKPI